MPSNGSIFGVTLDDKNLENGEIEDLVFERHFPLTQVEEDI